MLVLFDETFKTTKNCASYASLQDVGQNGNILKNLFSNRQQIILLLIDPFYFGHSCQATFGKLVIK